HGSRSGYSQLARHLAEQLPVETLEPDLPRRIPGRARRWLVEHSGMPWYDEWSLALEASAALRLLRGKNGVTHLLYGEDAFRYLGLLAPLARLRGGRLVASFHQPPSRFADVAASPRALRRLSAAIALS